MAQMSWLTFAICAAWFMVIAMLAACLGSDLPPADAVRMANLAAGLEVERIGVAVVHKDEIERELLTLAQGGGRKIVALDAAARAFVKEQARRMLHGDIAAVFCRSVPAGCNCDLASRNGECNVAVG